MSAKNKLKGIAYAKRVSHIANYRVDACIVLSFTYFLAGLFEGIYTTPH